MYLSFLSKLFPMETVLSEYKIHIVLTLKLCL